MKEVPLTRGKVAIVDDQDYDWLMQWKWQYVKGYARRTGLKSDGGLHLRSIMMHRVIANAPPDLRVDHINGDRADNRRENLRLCTPEQNKWHVVKRRGHNKYKGVRPVDGGCWRAYAADGHNGQTYLGYYATEEEGAIAYNRYAVGKWGEWASLNPIEDREIHAVTLADRSAKSTSGIYGVTFDRARNKWQAKLRRGRKHVFIGRYETKEEAADAVRRVLEEAE